MPKGQQTVVAAALRQALLQADQEAARRARRQVADQLRLRWPRLAALMDGSEHGVLAYMGFPVQHQTELHSTDELDKAFVRRGRSGGRVPRIRAEMVSSDMPPASGGKASRQRPLGAFAP